MRGRGPVLGIILVLGVACAPDPATPFGKADRAPTHACGDELKLSGRVVDAARVFPAEAQARLKATLAAYEARTHHQFVVVTTPTLGGSDVGNYSVRLFGRWGIGRRGINDGLGLLIAPSDQKVRIEVGYGLEHALPDDVAARIIREVSIPKFKAGDFGGGAQATIEASIAAVDRYEHKALPRP